jgi:hypothetical protein
MTFVIGPDHIYLSFVNDVFTFEFEKKLVILGRKPLFSILSHICGNLRARGGSPW